VADTSKPVPAQSAPVEDGPTLDTPAPPPAAAEAPYAEPDTAPAPGLEDLVGRAQHEYGRFVAAQNITVDGALAFVAGSPVPRSHLAQPKFASWVADGVVRDLEADPA
jgi:hypothetical protein